MGWWRGAEWGGVGWSGVEWGGVEWGGVEWSGYGLGRMHSNLVWLLHPLTEGDECVRALALDVGSRGCEDGGGAGSGEGSEERGIR